MRALVIASSLVLALATSALAQPEGEDESAALVDEGRRDLRARHYDDAARALDQAIELNPRRIEAYVLRAAVHAAKKEYDDGIALLRKALKLDADNPDVLAALGVNLIEAGQAEKGEAVLEAVVADDPHRFDAQVALGRQYAADGAWKRAVTALEAYLADRPKELASEDTYYQALLAEAYLRADRARDAESMYREVLEVRPEEVAARMGLAWAIAAQDCARADDALDDLSDLVADHPEILLVRGQCDLALGDGKAALRAGQRYLKAMSVAKRTPTAAGYALVGEAAFATGDLALAKKSLESARDVAPGKRRWALKLAIVLRRSGDAESGLAEVERMGAPETPADDLDWWRELGEALIAAGKPGDVEARYAAAGKTGDADMETIAGEAALRAGDATTAHAHLLAAVEARPGDPRAEAWLVRAKSELAAALIADGKLDDAEKVLAAADRHASQNDIADADVARNLGIVRLALDRAADAIAPLERAVAIDGSVESNLALGQAHARGGDPEKARAAYRAAAGAARGDLAVMVAIDLASFELGAGRPSDALDALDSAEVAAGKADETLAAQYREALLAARHAAGIAALRNGSAGRAVTLLEGADKLAAGKDIAVRCDLALATVASGDREKARKRLEKLKKVTCPFPAPADTQAIPILLAFTEGMDPKKAEKSLKTLARLSGKASGATKRLLATVTRVVALGAAVKAYNDGKLAKARKLLATAKKAETRAGADEIAHDLAVLDIADGKLDDAAAVLEKLASKLPEALINLGVIDDKKGDGPSALARWRNARGAGATFAPLDEWIAAKERIFKGKGR